MGRGRSSSVMCLRDDFVPLLGTPPHLPMVRASTGTLARVMAAGARLTSHGPRPSPAAPPMNCSRSPTNPLPPAESF